MALDFPNSPSVGQLFPNPPQTGVPVWKWDGTEWVPTSQTSVPMVYTQDTAPTGAQVGSLWFKSDTGQLFVYYNDGNSTQWVYAASSYTYVSSVNKGEIVGLTLS